MILSNNLNNLYHILLPIMMILILLLCSIPFIIGIIRNTLKANEEDEKYEYKRKRLKHIIIIVHLAIFFASVIAISVHSHYVFICYLLSMFTIYLYGKQSNIYYEKNKYKVIILIIEFLASIILLLEKQDPSQSVDSISLTAVLFFLFSILFILIEIVQLFTFKKMKPIENRKTKKHLPIGFLNKRQYNGYILTSVLCFAIFIFAFWGNDDFGLKGVIIWFVLFIIVLFGYILITQIFVNLKHYRKYLKTLDYSIITNEINNLSLNERIHPEYKNYLTMVYMNVIIAYDMVYYYELKEKVFKPNNKNYIKSYDLLPINILLSKEDYLVYKEMIHIKYAKDKAIIKRFSNYDSLMSLYYDGNINVDLNKLVPVNPEILHTVMMNDFYNVIYTFYSNPEKYIDQKNKFSEKYPDVKTLIQILESKVSN